VQQAIAILDSGVGGLTVVKEVMRQLPQEQIIYFGDSARSPYGPRPADEVKLFTRQIVDYLIEFHPKMIVIACNTATAVALEEIRQRVSIPVVGVISPGARAAIKMTRTGSIGVIGTDGTIRSGAYEETLKTISPTIQVHSQSCPLLAPMVEKGIFDGKEALQVIESSLLPLLDKSMDCLILGCTHYPYLTDVIGKVMGPEVSLINSAEETAREVSAILQHQNQLATGKFRPEHRFFCSGDPVLFKQITDIWLKEDITVTPVEWQAELV
jgi:glutamate racemase